MISEFNKRQLRFLVVPTRHHEEAYKKDLEQAYACWKAVWSQALANEMNVKEKLHSDSFSRQQILAVVFYGDEPLCLATLNPYDLNSERDLDDTYFKVWPEEVIQKIRKQSPHVMASCHATVNFKFRKGQLGFSGIEFLCAMLVQYLKSTNFETIVCTPRREKRVQEACYRTGATLHQEDLPYTIEGQRIDLITWHSWIDQDRWDPTIRELTHYVWENSTTIVKRSIHQGKKHAA
jgi:hypothetical protein